MARAFNGTSQYCSVASAVISAAPLTLACSQYVVDGATAHRTFGVHHSSGANQIALDVLNNANAGERAYWEKNAGTAVSSIRRGSDATGYAKICGIWTAYTSAPVLYSNGASLTSTSSAGSGGTGTLSETAVGSVVYNGTRYYGGGRSAEAAVWTIALAAQDGLAVSNGYSPILVRPVSLKAYWPLGGPMGIHDRDVITGAYSMTPANSPTWADHPPTIYPCECMCC